MRGDLLYVDAFTQVGPRAGKHPNQPWKLSDLLSEMDFCSISGAMVASTMGARYDLMHSNLELSSWIAPHDHLFPIWSVMPHGTGEFPEPRKLEALMRRHGVRSISIHPKTNAWDPFAPHSGKFFQWIQKKKLLTIINRTEFDCYAAFERLVSDYPDISLLLTGAHWMDQRYVLPMLGRCPNLHISFDHFQIHYGLEDLVSAGFEDRLLFASNCPQMAIGPHRCYIDYADIPSSARRKIAGENLIRLAGGLRPKRLHSNADEDVLMTAARHGTPLSVPLIDMHMHILEKGMNGAGGAYRMSRGHPQGVFRLQNRLGCIGGGLMSWNGTVGADSASGNRCVAKALDAAPPGYWGLATFDPTHYSRSEMEKMISAVCKDRRFIGMKPYFSYGVEYSHVSYDIWWRHGNQHRFYAGIHRTRDDFSEVDKLAKKYPGVRWVVYHCGSDYSTAERAIETMKKHSNVYAEITFTTVTHGIIEFLVKHAGPDRVLYGSDLPMRDPRQQLGWVVFSRLSLSAKKRVLGTNAVNVIQPCLHRLPPYNRPLTSHLQGKTLL